MRDYTPEYESFRDDAVAVINGLAIVIAVVGHVDATALHGRPRACRWPCAATLLNPRSQGRPHPGRLPHHGLRHPRDVVVAGQAHLLSGSHSAGGSIGELAEDVRLAADVAGQVDHVLGAVAAEEEPAKDAARVLAAAAESSSRAKTIQRPSTRKSASSACSTPFTYTWKGRLTPSGSRTRDPCHAAKSRTTGLDCGSMAEADIFGARDTLPGGEAIYRLDRVVDPLTLPYTVCVLLENLLRRAGTEHVREEDVRALAAWPAPAPAAQLAFMPARVLMQDLTGVPAVVDLAALRAAVDRRGADPGRVDPLVPGRPRHRPLGAGGRVRVRRGLRAQHRAGVRAKRRALPAPALGAARVPQLPRRAARDGHLPPGEPRVPRPGRPGARRRRAARHAGRHRLAHHHDQRDRRARVGRRRHRGRGGHARPAAVHDPAAGASACACRGSCAPA